MNTATCIKERKTDIKKCIFFLMKGLRERLSEEHIKKVKDKEGKLFDKKDYRYPFEMQLDELPFFSLYVNLKKATYEHLLVLCHEADEMNEDDYAALAEKGIIRENGKLKFVPLKDFVPKSKPHPFCILDTEKLDAYLNEIEVSLLYSITDSVTAALLIKFDAEKDPSHKVEADGNVTSSIFDNDEVDFSELEFLKKDNLWCATSINLDENAKELYLPCGEQIGKAYLESKGFDIMAKEGNRTAVLQLLTQSHFNKLCGVVDTVVDTLFTPAYEISETTILEILEETFTGMKRLVLAKQLDYFTQGSEKLFTKGELTKALGVASEKFNKYAIALYGDKAFTEEQLKNALRAINQPIDLLEIK